MEHPNLDNKDQENPFLKGIVAGALLTGMLFFFYLGGAILSEKDGKKELSSRSPAQSQSDPVHRKAVELVNRNLQMDQKIQELKALGVEVKNEEHLRQIQKKLAELENRDTRGLGVEVIVEDGSAAVLEDLEESANQSDSEMTPQEKIELSMMRQREIAAYEHKQRLQYVRKFLENAREKGYDIVLNDKLEVVRVKKINQQEPFKGDQSISELFE